MKVALLGNPNVGKSLLFNAITGLGVEVANYPGTTGSVLRGSVCIGKEPVEVMDLPGVYTLSGSSEDEVIVSSFLANHGADIIIAVLDGTRLSRNLYLFLEASEYGLPMIMVLNMADETERLGLTIDTKKLMAMTGVPIIAASALLGRNVHQILPLARKEAQVPTVRVEYGTHLEAAIESLSSQYPLTRGEALATLLGRGRTGEVREAAQILHDEVARLGGESPETLVAGKRHGLAGRIAGEVEGQVPGKRKPPDLDRFLTRNLPGIPILIGVLVGMLLVVFLIGSWLEGIIILVTNTYVIEPFLAFPMPDILRQTGLAFLLGLQGGLGIAFPFVFTFSILLSVIEDTGYLTRAAFLADRAMHHLGLHGQAIIPLVLGFGCSVPAVMSLRLLETKRERFIAAFLVPLVPCSARTVVIAGIVAAFVGIAAAFTAYLIIAGVILVTGIFLSRVSPGPRLGMVLEMAPLRVPTVGNVLKKSWGKMQEFLLIAMPLLLVTSILLGLFQYSGLIPVLEAVIDPVSEAVLGLPGFAVAALVFGILRKEMAFEMLAVLSGNADLSLVMTKAQLFIFAIVSSLFIPCISTVAVLKKQVGLKTTLLVVGYTLALGIFAGWLLNLVFASLLQTVG